MRAGGTPGPTRMQTSPPAYLKHQGSAGPRLSPTYTLFILWRVLYINLSILLIQIIRKHLDLFVKAKNPLSYEALQKDLIQAHNTQTIALEGYNPFIKSISIITNKINI